MSVDKKWENDRLCAGYFGYFGQKIVQKFLENMFDKSFFIDHVVRGVICHFFGDIFGHQFGHFVGHTKEDNVNDVRISGDFQNEFLGSFFHMSIFEAITTIVPDS
jgi:hypothetical protein